MGVVYRKVIDYARFIFAGYKKPGALTRKALGKILHAFRHRLRLLHLLFISYSLASFSIYLTHLSGNDYLSFR